MENNKDIEILKEMLENKEDIIKYHSWIGTKSLDAIENVLSELEKKDNQIKLEIEGRDLLVHHSENLKSELETYKKIAEKLAEEVLALDVMRANKTYDHARIWETEKGIIDWARKEVEKNA